MSPPARRDLPAGPLDPTISAGRAGSTYELQNVEAGIGNVDGGTEARVVERAWRSAERRPCDISTPDQTGSPLRRRRRDHGDDIEGMQSVYRFAARVMYKVHAV